MSEVRVGYVYVERDRRTGRRQLEVVGVYRDGWAIVKVVRGGPPATFRETVRRLGSAAFYGLLSTAPISEPPPPPRRRRTARHGPARPGTVNMERAQQTAAETVPAVRWVISQPFMHLSAVELEAARLRVEHQDESLGQLAARAGWTKDKMASAMRRVVARYRPEQGPAQVA